MATLTGTSPRKPSTDASRLTTTVFSAPIIKGQLNKLRSRLPAPGQSQESSRSVQAQVTSSQIVGQVVKIPEDNVSGLLLTVESQPAGETLDMYEASEANMQTAWAAGGTVATRDTTNFTQGAASLALDHSVNTNVYTYTMSSIKHGAVTGTFEANETVTGGTSLATGVVVHAATGRLWLISVTGTFQSGETLTGGTSSATATSSSLLLTSVDWSTAHFLTLDIRASDKAEQQLQLTISDGTNTSSTTMSVSDKQVWTSHRLDLAVIAAAGAPAAVDLSAVTQILVQPITKAKAGYTLNIDNLQWENTPGTLGVRLYDMGATKPVSATTKLSDGTSKNLGDLGIKGSASALLTVDLHGGKELLQVDDFSCGNAKEIPSNTLLTKGNYYIIALEYTDTDVDVYGADPSYANDNYSDGYAFTAPDTATAITAIGAYNDCMFNLLTAQPTHIEHVTVIGDADPGGGHFVVVAEDTSMAMSTIAHGVAWGTESSFDISALPVKMPSGGKFEVYYSDVFSSDLSRVTVAVRHWAGAYDPYTGE